MSENINPHTSRVLFDSMYQKPGACAFDPEIPLLEMYHKEIRLYVAI